MSWKDLLPLLRSHFVKSMHGHSMTKVLFLPILLRWLLLKNFFEAVLDERKWEFAGENMRWRDLVRNNSLWTGNCL